MLELARLLFSSSAFLASSSCACSSSSYDCKSSTLSSSSVVSSSASFRIPSASLLSSQRSYASVPGHLCEKIDLCAPHVSPEGTKVMSVIRASLSHMSDVSSKCVLAAEYYIESSAGSFTAQSRTMVKSANLIGTKTISAMKAIQNCLQYVTERGVAAPK